MGLIDFINSLVQAAQQYTLFIAIGLLVIGIFTTFWGSHWLKTTQIIQGFIAGFVIVCILSFYVKILSPKDTFLLGLWGGIISAIFMLVSNSLTRFLMGAYMVGLLAVVGELSAMTSLNPYVTVIAMLLGGYIFTIIEDFVIATIVAIAGAWSLVAGVALLCGLGWFNPIQALLNPADNLVQNIILFLGWLSVAVAGALVQVGVLKKKKLQTGPGESETEPQPETDHEEPPAKIAVKRDIGWDILTQPRKTGPLPPLPETRLSKVEPPSLPLPEPRPSRVEPPPFPETFSAPPEEVKLKPRKRWVNPFFTDPFTTKEDLVEDKSKKPPKVSPFKQD